ncbi:hypothetical protein AMATHDRAFT_75538 [Amanita thiersii Skay4041]|uniref:Protein BIG1 n=1 Tax=Amanita thiersii Skay4041 TaxID=703135 RepID=A0A2A9NS15_9AGAR|nr:hypothetical protein AMATHDRAFT_75538 [Amanita thiersii Skay4041]
MAVSVLLLAAFSSLVSAYSDTAPFLAWSSHPSNALNSLPTSFQHFDSPLRHVLSNDDLCTHNAIIVIDHPGLHASDLRSLPSSHLSQMVSSTPHVRHYPYVPIDPSLNLLNELDSVSQLCESRLVHFVPGESVTFEHDTKHVVHLRMPSLMHLDEPRRIVAADHESMVSSELDYLTSIFPNYLVIYTGSPLTAEFSKRQSPDISSSLKRPSLHSQFQQPSANTTLSEGGILKRYQLLTPGLITTLLIVLFVLLPIVMVGIHALASIQSPLRVEAPKGYSARDKKTQ